MGGPVDRRGGVLKTGRDGVAALTVADDLEGETHRNRGKGQFETLFQTSVQHAGGDVVVPVGAIPDGL